jgi:protein arginine kinase activator
MLCEQCQKREATVHYTKVVNDQKTEYHLCEQCAREKGELDFTLGFEPGFSIHNLLAGLLDMGSAGRPVEKKTTGVSQCPKCGLNYTQFSQTGRLGCGECYTAFERQLEPLLRRIQGTSTHTGKVPGRQGGTLKLEREIGRLARELETAVEREEFERAAELRDKLKELRRQLAEGQGGRADG